MEGEIIIDNDELRKLLTVI